MPPATKFAAVQPRPRIEAERFRWIMVTAVGFSWLVKRKRPSWKSTVPPTSRHSQVFLDFRERLNTLAGVPESWRAALSAVSGIYLFTHPDTGKQYVGSAQGAGGFWGRWEHYVASGHGGNRRMQDIPAADYQVSVLEVASSSAGADILAKMEERRKQKLLSRRFGLNAN